MTVALTVILTLSCRLDKSLIALLVTRLYVESAPLLPLLWMTASLNESFLDSDVKKISTWLDYIVKSVGLESNVSKRWCD